MAQHLKVCKVPTDALAITNCVIVNGADLDARAVKHIDLQPEGSVLHYIFSIKNDGGVPRGSIAVAVPQRRWAQLSLDSKVTVRPHAFQHNEYISGITLSVNFQTAKNASSEPLNSDAMAKEFSMQFVGQAFVKGQELIFYFTDEKQKLQKLKCLVKNIDGADMSKAGGGGEAKPYQLEAGQLLPNSTIIFDKEQDANINLIGKSKGKSSYRSIIHADWDFQQMGIGGLDNEFSEIFRRAFASRVFPPEFIEQLGMKHVRGMLLYGPPGTGKTLMARQIGKMLNAREPKIVNGPQILDKYVGESESNIRKLFADAEEEWRRCGSNSGLHIIIFDEIDAICKQRGSMAGSSSVHDTVVNQLLSKMDGVEQLNNILVIGMTNRKDMIDEALLRPGRLEVQLEVSLPDEAGRVQILKIHTARMREYNKLDPSVDIEELAKKTKNFSGAEIEGLVRAAQSSAMNRLVKGQRGGKVEISPDAIEQLCVNMADFEHALANDIKPVFGRSDESLERFLRHGMVIWGPEVQDILNQGQILVNSAKNPNSRGFVTAVFAGAPKSGKSCLAAQIAKESEFPFIKVISPEDIVGFSETAKCQVLRKAFEDAIKSRLSVLFIDDLEELVDYSPVGPRYANSVLRALFVLLKKLPPVGHRLLVLATSSNREFLREFGLINAFQRVVDVPLLTRSVHVQNVLEESDIFNASELLDIRPYLEKIYDAATNGIGIKRLTDLIDYTRECEEGLRAQTIRHDLEAIALGLL